VKETRSANLVVSRQVSKAPGWTRSRKYKRAEQLQWWLYVLKASSY
jgi:hypothetical protein